MLPFKILNEKFVYNFYLIDITKKSGYRLLGDVEFSEAKKRAAWITPVPGGKVFLY